MTKHISQREAHRMRKRIGELEAQLRDQSLHVQFVRLGKRRLRDGKDAAQCPARREQRAETRKEFTSEHGHPGWPGSRFTHRYASREFLQKYFSAASGPFAVK